MGEKERQYMLLGFALLFALLTGFYTLYVTPVLQEKEQTQLQLEQIQAQRAAVSSQPVAAPTAPPLEKVRKIAELFPVKPYTDQLIKDLGKLQTISRIELQSASFTEQKAISTAELVKKFIPQQSDAAPVSGQSGQSASAGQQGQAASTISIGQGKEQKQINVQQIQSSMPQANINSIEIILSIKGDYKAIYNFVTEVQNLSRYLRVDSLSFSSTEKDEFEIPKEKAMTASVKLTSYYAPQFASLLDKLPPVDVEKPSEKWDPTQYPIIKKEDMEKQNQDTAKQNK